MAARLGTPASGSSSRRRVQPNRLSEPTIRFEQAPFGRRSNR